MSDRVFRTLALRRWLADRDAWEPQPLQRDNGDESRYADKRATYTKGVAQDSVGIVDPVAYASFAAALDSGDPAAFERILLGAGGKTLNGPQGGLAFYLSGLDGTQIGVPPAPRLASKEYAVELIELYWASLLRDRAFAGYGADAVAANAAAELTKYKPYYRGPTNAAGDVTPDLLFRGPFAREDAGPYLSALLSLPANFGALAVDQKYATLPPDVDYMLTAADFEAVQNGASPPYPAQLPPQPLADGRGLAAYTHGDVLYQAYLIANQVLSTIGHPVNPGNPYVGSKTQNGFATFGGPDFAATLALVANEALRVVWWQKWFVHLRHRPESGGALVHLQKNAGFDPATPDPIVLASDAVAASAAKNGGSYFLSQTFPEGSPTHPAYPTGHGAVAGACITVLKFFWNGAATVAGTAGLTLDGELHKLASNVSFGHGIHAGIHWRSDTTESIVLGEKVALAILRDRAQTYNEKFSTTIALLDGTAYTISNR